MVISVGLFILAGGGKHKRLHVPASNRAVQWRLLVRIMSAFKVTCFDFHLPKPCIETSSGIIFKVWPICYQLLIFMACVTCSHLRADTKARGCFASQLNNLPQEGTSTELLIAAGAHPDSGQEARCFKDSRPHAARPNGWPQLPQWALASVSKHLRKEKPRGVPLSARVSGENALTM